MTTPVRQRVLTSLAASILLASLSAGPLRADDGEKTPDLDEIQRAVERGDILPLSDLRKAVAKRLAGDILDVEIETEGGHILYEFKVLTESGRIAEIKIRARDAVIVEIENE